MRFRKCGKPTGNRLSRLIWNLENRVLLTCKADETFHLQRHLSGSGMRSHLLTLSLHVSGSPVAMVPAKVVLGSVLRVLGGENDSAPSAPRRCLLDIFTEQRLRSALMLRASSGVAEGSTKNPKALGHARMELTV